MSKKKNRYIIKLHDDAYVCVVSISKVMYNEGKIYCACVPLPQIAMTFVRKGLAEEIAKALGGQVEEFIV